MKQGFLTKAFVAVGVMASAVVLSSMCAFAATKYSWEVPAVDNETTVGTTGQSAGDRFTILNGASIQKGTQTDVTTGLSNAKGIKLGSNLTTTEGVESYGVKFTVAESELPAKISAVIKSGGSNTTGLSIYTSAASDTNTGEAVVEAFKDKGAFKGGSYIINTAGTYYLGRTVANKVSGLYVYGVELEVNASTTQHTVTVSGVPDTYPTVTATLDDVYEPENVNLSWEGNDSYIAGSTSVAIANATLTGTNYNVAFSSFSSAFTEKITFADSVDFTAYASSKFTGESILCDKKVKLLAPFKTDSSKGVIGNEGSQTFTIANGTSVTKTSSLQTGGAGSESSRAIVVKTKTNGKVYLYASSNGGSKRNIKVNSTVLGSVSSTTVEAFSFDATAGTEYTIYSEDGTIRMFMLGSTAEFDTFSPITTSSSVYGKASVYANNNNYYIVSVISADDIADTTKSTIDQQYNGTSILDAKSNTAYASVKFASDDTVYTAEDFGGESGDCIFATQLDTTIDNAIADGKVCTAIKAAILSVDTVVE